MNEAANLRAGLIAATLVNLNRKRGTQPVKPQDFFRAPKREQTPEEMARVLDALTARQARMAATKSNGRA